MNSEKYIFKTPTGCERLLISLSVDALCWLDGTTRTNDGKSVQNRTLLFDLVSRMQLVDKVSSGFRRPQELNAGQAQYSEILLQAEWNIGRKVIRRLLDEMEGLGLIELSKSTVASTMTFPFIVGWSIADSGLVGNPYCRSMRVATKKGGLA